MLPEEEKQYSQAIKLWSPIAQIGMLHEEMAELVIAINKFDRGKDNLDHIAEEMADVKIMLDQMQILFKISDEDLKRWHDIKFKKMKKMLEDGIL